MLVLGPGRRPLRRRGHAIDRAARRCSISTRTCWPGARRWNAATTPHLRIGCAAGFSGDRTDAAAPVVQALIASGQPAVLIFETLAERTLALAQLARRTQPDAGYEPLLVDLLQPVLADCLAHGVRIVSNFGAANPAGAARRIHQLAARWACAPRA
jgi:hypothetical protein